MPTKTALRAALLARRAQRSPWELTLLGRRLLAVAQADELILRAGCVAGFASLGGEPPTGPLLDALAVRGTRLLLPVTRAAGMLDWASYTGSSRMRPGRWGLLEPVGPRLGSDALADAEVVLVPALAVDAYGHRLGRGGGFYDRALARLPAQWPGARYAIVFGDEVLPELPSEPHDIRVDAVLTPDGMQSCLPSGDARPR